MEKTAIIISVVFEKQKRSPGTKTMKIIVNLATNCIINFSLNANNNRNVSYNRLSKPQHFKINTFIFKLTIAKSISKKINDLKKG